MWNKERIPQKSKWENLKKNSVKESNVSIKKIFKLKLCWQKNLKKEKCLKFH